MLKVQGLRAGYGAINILWDIDFQISEGEIVAILGSNGAGKTTMVRALTGMIRPSAGIVEFNGEVWRKKTRGIFLKKGLFRFRKGGRSLPK